MFAWMRSILGLIARSIDAGAPGRRFRAGDVIRNTNADIARDARSARERARHAAINLPAAAAAVTSLVSNMVGSGIRPVPRHPDPATRRELVSMWDRWAVYADLAGRADMYGLQALAARQMIVDGEAFALLRIADDVPSGVVPLHVQLISADQVPMDVPLSLDGRIRAGIEHDDWGRRLAYHMLRQRPGEPFGPFRGWDLETIRVPADDVLHVFRPVDVGQVRGVTWFSSVLGTLTEAGDLVEATIRRAKLSNLVGASIRTADGKVGPFSDAETRSDIDAADASLEPGAVLRLLPGEDLTFYDPKPADGLAAIHKALLRQIAAGIGVPYDVISGDLEGANYSSMRAGLVEFRRRLETWQWGIIIPQLCDPIWHRFVNVAVLAGLIPVEAFAADPAAWLTVEWLPPKPAWVDPQKDATAEITMIAAGLKSRTQAVAELGYDIAQIDAELAAERARAKELGLTFTAGSGQAAAPQGEAA